MKDTEDKNELTISKVENLFKRITRRQRSILTEKIILWKIYGKGSRKDVLDYLREISK